MPKSKKPSTLESEILAGAGSEYISAELAGELFKTGNGSTIDVAQFVSEARSLAKSVKSGDNGHLVDKLSSQLHLLDVLFTRTTRLAVAQNNPERMLAILDMALKVQNHTRRTASTISELTHPKANVSFIRAENANVATNQQINYSEKNLGNELNTGDIHEMDRRSSGKASRANQEIEALVEVDRA
ncbi:hypothetical protein [Marinobacterium sp. LSUCC0821]|uniref:hypothetical protein n=1 Tax=Marinobacterium sp. LSUCC0821 TaxID=2668067 RepID=UPI001451147F|nr:hypothetical protein [Marinobacterium sp. LSUCC0821]QJD72078.1 hypothetical protein HH196_10380 [Marinobacterium sp. LSUCC0821]